MKEKKFDENVENIYKTLSDEQKAEYKAKTEKLFNGFYVAGIVLLAISAVFSIGIIIGAIVIQSWNLLIALIMGIGFIGISLYLILSSRNILKASDEVKIKTQVNRLEMQKKQAIQTQKNNYSPDMIKKVTLIDSYTEWSDKLHAVLNYQEIIQTRMYKFNVEYNDGTSKIVTAAENSQEYNALMPLVGKTTEQPMAQFPSNNIEKLREYKKLLDDGVITQDEFAQKKKELL